MVPVRLAAYIGARMSEPHWLLNQNGQGSPWCPHGVNQNASRCLQCQPYPYGSNFNSSFGESAHGLLNRKLDVLYNKLLTIEKLLEPK